MLDATAPSFFFSRDLGSSNYGVSPVLISCAIPCASCCDLIVDLFTMPNS